MNPIFNLIKVFVRLFDTGRRGKGLVMSLYCCVAFKYLLNKSRFVILKTKNKIRIVVKVFYPLNGSIKLYKMKI